MKAAPLTAASRNKDQHGDSVPSAQRYICVHLLKSNRTGNISDEALFTKCCVHGIPLVFSLVLQGEFLSITLFVRMVIPARLHVADLQSTEERSLRKPHGPNTGSHLFS